MKSSMFNYSTYMESGDMVIMQIDYYSVKSFAAIYDHTFFCSCV